MTESELGQQIERSAIITKWHYFSYHFGLLLSGEPSPFAESLLKALLSCDKAIPGFATSMVNEIAALSGRERWERHYWQLMQRLGELLIASRLVECALPGATLVWEQLDPSRRRRSSADLYLEFPDRIVAIEVKTPDLGEHRKKRAANWMQLPGRGVLHPEHARSLPYVTLPRDNPVKDFLVSAQSKFARETPEKALETLLIIVWDSYAFEAITALSGMAGLLTDRSFARSADGGVLTFPMIGGVLVTQHLSVMISEAAERTIDTSATHALDYGRPGQEPFKVFTACSDDHVPSEDILECFQAIDPEPGTELGPVEFVHWFN